MKLAPMVPPEFLDLVFAALADATRRDLLIRMGQEEVPVTTLAQPLQMSLPAVSKHLRVLEKAGLVNRRVDGRTHFISANPKPLRAAVNWIEHHRAFWESSLDKLAALVESAPAAPPTSPPATPPAS